MPWVAFQSRQAHTHTRPQPSAPPPDTASTGSSSLAAPSTGNERATLQPLSPTQLDSLQRENEQLKEIIRQLAEKAKASAPPAANPSAASATSSSSSSTSPSSPTPFVFQRIPGLGSWLQQSVPSPSAPHASSSSQSASSVPSSTSPSAPPPPDGVDVTPVVDFYASLRSALKKDVQSSSSSALVPSSTSTLSDDEWGRCDSDTDASSTAAKKTAPSVRHEDEAVVHSRSSAVVVTKIPPKPKLHDDSGSLQMMAPSAASSASMDDEFGEDDFDMAVSAGAQAAVASACAAAAASNDPSEEEVGILDLSDVEWWTVVPHPDRPNEAVVAAPPPQLDPQEDEDGFVVVRKQDSVSAIAEFISQMMLKHPDIARLSPEELKSMLESSVLSQVDEPGVVGKAWSYGKTMYTCYTYASTAWGLYKDQTYLRMVAAGVIKTAGWICFFLI